MPICKEQRRIAEVLHQSLLMREDRSEVSGKILSLTLEIIFLLTGEDLVLSKKKRPTDACQSCLSEGLAGDQSPCEERPPPSPKREEETPEPDEAPRSATQEVPVRCEDVAKEEWEYREGHKEGDEEVVPENRRPPVTAGGRTPADPPRSGTSPLASQERTAEDNRMETQECQAPPGEGISLPQCKEEVIPVKIGSDGDIATNPPESCTSHPVSWQCMEEAKKTTTPDYQISPGGGILLRQCKEEDVPVEISSGDHHTINPPEISGGHVFSQSGIKEDNSMDLEESQAVTGDNILPNRCKEEPNPSKSSIGPPTSWKVQLDSSYVLVPVCHKNGDNPSNPEGTISSDFHPRVVIVEPKTVLSLVPSLKCETDQPDLLWQEPQGDASSSTLIKCDGGDINLPSVVHECQLCKKSFEKETDLIAHKKLFHCALCHKCFRDKSSLVVHQWSFHKLKPNTNEPPQAKCATQDQGLFSCIECGKLFTNKSSFNRHQNVHTGAFTCLDCGRCVSDKAGLIRHRKTHKGESPFACSDCGRRFSQRYQLFSHQRVHEESFSCSDCGKLFSAKSILEAHQASHKQ